MKVKMYLKPSLNFFCISLKSFSMTAWQGLQHGDTWKLCFIKITTLKFTGPPVTKTPMCSLKITLTLQVGAPLTSPAALSGQDSIRSSHKYTCSDISALCFPLSSFPSLISICNALLPLAWTQHTVITLTMIDISSYGIAISAIIYLWYTFMKITISCLNIPKWSPHAAVIIYDILRNYLISTLSQLLFMRQSSMQYANKWHPEFVNYT